jgi:hypothetical protein
MDLDRMGVADHVFAEPLSGRKEFLGGCDISHEFRLVDGGRVSERGFRHYE